MKLLSTHSAPHVRLIWPKEVGDFDEKTNSFVYLMDEISCEYNAIAMVMKNPDLLTMDQKMEICRQMAEVFQASGTMVLFIPMFPVQISATVSLLTEELMCVFWTVTTFH